MTHTELAELNRLKRELAEDEATMLELRFQYHSLCGFARELKRRTSRIAVMNLAGGLAVGTLVGVCAGL